MIAQPQVLADSSRIGAPVVLIDFWASWCDPCMVELPHIEHIGKSVQGHNVVIVGVNVDRSRDAARQAVGRLGLTFPIVADSGIFSAYGANVLPTLVIVRPDGTVLETHEGYGPNIEVSCP